jgi:signal transduction histidine kinase
VNLLSNALKFSNKGSTVNVKLTIISQGDLQISNNIEEIKEEIVKQHNEFSFSHISSSDGKNAV